MEGGKKNLHTYTVSKCLLQVPFVRKVLHNGFWQSEGTNQQKEKHEVEGLPGTSQVADESSSQGHSVQQVWPFQWARAEGAGRVLQANRPRGWWRALNMFEINLETGLLAVTNLLEHLGKKIKLRYS